MAAHIASVSGTLWPKTLNVPVGTDRPETAEMSASTPIQRIVVHPTPSELRLRLTGADEPLTQMAGDHEENYLSNDTPPEYQPGILFGAFSA